MSSEGSSAPTHVRASPRRASTYFVILVVLACGVGAVYLWRPVGSMSVYTAARDLPAYHVINELDVRREQVHASDVPDHAVTVRDELLGHYTLVAVQQDDAFDYARLGPAINAGELDGRGIVGITASYADVLGGGLARGEHVDLLLSPRQHNVGPGMILRDVLLLDLEKQPSSAAGYVVVLAVSRGDESHLARAGGSSQVYISRLPNG